MRAFFATLVLGATLSGCATAPPAPQEPPADFRATAPEPLAPRPWEFPHVTRVTLDNGLRVLVAENRSAPLVTIRSIVHAGAERDPASHAGLATMTANLLDEGAGGRSAIELAEAFGNLGTSVGTWAEWDLSGAGVDVLSSGFDPALALFADVVLRPDFPQEHVDRLVKERMTTLIQQRDNASIVANNRFASVVYGPTQYGRSILGDEASVSRLSRRDIREFYRHYYVPNNASIIVTGDVDSEVAIARVRELFGGWERGEVPAELDIQPPTIDASRIYIVDRPQAVQSEIRVGHPGVERSTRDYFPLLVMNTILGGNFGSRINLNLRERHGYTYGARSSFQWRTEPGPFVVSTPVRTEVTLPAVQEILSELRAIRSGEVTDDEIEAAKNYQAGIFPATVESASDLANRLTDMEVYGLPEDYFDSYRRNIMNVSKSEVRRVAEKYIQPDALAIVIVGKAEEVREPLGQLGLPIGVYQIEATAVP